VCFAPLPALLRNAKSGKTSHSHSILTKQEGKK